MYARPPRTYQYKQNDSPVSVASQYNLHPTQLLNANPGGFPFSTGQQINIPPVTTAIPGQTFNYAVAGEGSTVDHRKYTAPTVYQTSHPWANMPNYAPPAVPSGMYNGTPNMAQPLNTPPGGMYVGQGTYLPGQGASFGMSTPNTPVVGGYQGMTPGNSSSFQTIKDRLAGMTPEQAEAELATLTPSLRDAVTNQINGVSSDGSVTNALGTGSEEFMNTKFMKKNLEQGTAFENQLRWDPDRKKYVQIGKLIAEGRLNPRDKNARLSRRKRGGGGGQGGGQQGNDPNARLTGFGLVNFNIGGG
jgi:hypothetical protein